jgi:tetratricopeptide (TPR) repeat protein
MPCLALAPADRTQNVEEVSRELTRKRIRKEPFVAAALLMALLAAVVWFVPSVRKAVHDSIWPPHVRLAVLPYEGPKELAGVADGALQETAERIRNLPSGRRTVAVIPPSRVSYMHAETPQQARDVLHATHLLKLSVRFEGRDIATQASVIELDSQLAIRDLSARYSPGEMAEMPTALTGLVAMAFGLREKSPDAPLNSAATRPYLEGLSILNHDIRSYDNAIPKFQAAADLDPKSAVPVAAIALALVQKFDGTRQTIYLDRAREFVRRAQSLSPDSVRVLMAAGRVDEASSQYHSALQAYGRILELEPRNADALVRMAVVYEQLKEPDEALASLQKARDLDTDYYRPYMQLGQFYYRRGLHSNAAEQYRKAVARAPGLFDGYSSLAGELVELGRLDEAEAAVNNSLNIRETSQGLNVLGAIRAYQARYEEAAAMQKRALAYEPNNYVWVLNIGDNTRWAGHAAEARSYYRRGWELASADLALNPQSPQTRAYFAYFCARLGDKPRAKQEISQAMSLAPGNNEVLEEAVEIYELFGDRDHSIALLPQFTLAELKEISRQPDLADFSRDPRFKQQMIDKGGQ